MIQVKKEAPQAAATARDAQNKNIHIHVKPTEAENQVLFDFLTKKSFGYESGFIQGYLVAASLILTGRFCDD